MNLVGGLQTSGQQNPLAWQHRIVCQSIIAGTPSESAFMKDGVDESAVEGARDLPYPVPNLLVEWCEAPRGVPMLWWRSVGHSHTAFAVESFIDELAHAAGKDPFEYRRDLLANHPRHKRALELAAEKAGWGKPPPEGRGRGLAVHESFQSFIAQVAETKAAYEGANSKLEGLNNDIDKAEDELEEKIDKLKDEVSKWTEEFLQEHQENVQGLQTLIEAVEEMIDQRLAEAISTIEEIAKTVSDECSEHADGIASQFEDLANEGYQVVKNGVKEVRSLEPRIDVADVWAKNPNSKTAGIAEALAQLPATGGTLWFPKDKGP